MRPRLLKRYIPRWYPATQAPTPIQTEDLVDGRARQKFVIVSGSRYCSRSHTCADLGSLRHDVDIHTFSCVQGFQTRSPRPPGSLACRVLQSVAVSGNVSLRCSQSSNSDMPTLSCIIGFQTRPPRPRPRVESCKGSLCPSNGMSHFGVLSRILSGVWRLRVISRAADAVRYGTIWPSREHETRRDSRAYCGLSAVRQPLSVSVS